MSACEPCLRRSNMIATLAPRIEDLLQRPRERIAQVLALNDEDLIAALAPHDKAADVAAEIAAFEPDDLSEQARRANLGAICRHDRRYPGPLRELIDAPAVLWIRGSLDRFAQLLADPAVAVVGSRRASAYGLEVAEQLGRELASAGVTVVSGMALGIDAAAHRGALRSAEAKTIAILGSGADVPYPALHRRLHAQIAEAGAVVSESVPGRRPFRWTFPARNRLMAALTAVTVVVEARRDSGSLITATFATAFGRTVAAVPGRVTDAGAAGTNELLRDGATLVRDAGDVLDELFGVGGAQRLAAAAETARPPLADDEDRVLAAVEQGVGAGGIAGETGLASAQVRAALGRLELLGLIVRTGIGSYERRATGRT
jgi:DNA processing protein